MTITKQGNNRPFTGQMNPRAWGFMPVGPQLFCSIWALPQNGFQPVLVEKIKVLRENSRGKASQETIPFIVGKGAFQVKVRYLQ